MLLCFNDILYAFSYALDCVEKELIGSADFHGKRVAYLSVEMAKQLSFSTEALLDLAACAILHDNALTEYIAWERKENTVNILEHKQDIALAQHCILGERNIKNLPFHTDVTNAILYHHEHADGSGPLGKTQEDTPLFAQIIHLADILDVRWHLGEMTSEKYKKLQKALEEAENKEFSTQCIQLFQQAFPLERLEEIRSQGITTLLREALPMECREYTPEEVLSLANFFARIIDYKSDQTGRHCRGVAEKMQQMAIFYGADEITATKAYLAGAVHDVGKLVVPNDILEKPGKLTEEEYFDMKNHAQASHFILQQIQGFEEITPWAVHHHEKLNGKGYPFGKKAEELGKYERMAACLDIYQALTEARSYKEGFSHQRAMEILREMAERGELDQEITEDLDLVFTTYPILSYKK